MLMQQVDCAPPPLRSPPGSEEIPSAIAKVILNNLAKSPDDRAENARDFARALRQAAEFSNVSIEKFGPASTLWNDSEDYKAPTSIDGRLPNS